MAVKVGIRLTGEIFCLRDFRAQLHHFFLVLGGDLRPFVLRIHAFELEFDAADRLRMSLDELF